MRPLAVLVLVAGAIAALAFAFIRVQDSDNSGGSSNAARPTVLPEVIASGSNTPTLVIPDAGPAGPTDLDTGGREAVESPLSASGEVFDNYIEGTVVGPGGELVAGAKVELLKDAGDAEVGAMLMIMAGTKRAEAIRTLETKEDGLFRFSRLEPGNHWSVRVSHPSFQEQQVGPIDAPEEGGVEEFIQLTDGFVVFGRVVASGTQIPIAGATILLENPAAAYMPRLRATMKPVETVTDESGYYELRNVSPQGKLLACMAKGYATQLNQRDTSMAGATERRKQIDFELEEGMIIAGTVTGPDGKGIEGLRIDGFGSSEKGSSRGAGVSGSGGEFLISDVGEGRYTLRVDAGGLAKRNLHCDQVQASAGDRNVEIRLQAQGGLMGIVAGSDGPLSRFTITIRRDHVTNKAFGQIVKKQTFRSKNGEFRVEGLDQGVYVVQADASEYTSSFSEKVTIEQGQTTPDVRVQMTEGGTITGLVLDTYTQEPIAGARVTTFDNNHISSEFTDLLVMMAPTGLTKSETTTDSEGRFELPLILPDSYQVRVEQRGYTSYTTNDVMVQEGAQVEIGKIVLSKGGVIRGTAFLADGQVGAGVEVAVAPVNGAFGTGVRSRADAQGNFVLQNIPPGTYKLTGARSATDTESPFIKIIDMKKSEVEITVIDGEELSVDIYLGGR
ncbi:MAG: hypothetical protein ACI82F_001721 [Planctomycetota bacterium]|jgi:hypothetical protein